MNISKIGLFGMLRLMKWTTNEQVAAFPVEEETVTFERNPTCSVCLHYPEINVLHVEIVLLERQVHDLFAFNASIHKYF
jgi:hypothetical protein